MPKQKGKDPLVWGIILIVLGLIFLLHNIDIDIWNSLAKLWPLIIIFWGGWKLYYGIKEHKAETENTED